jgi:opacity protein-like surface antigen
MKKSLITTLVAVPVLSLSSMAFAAEPVQAEPIVLSSVQMDGVTAGFNFSAIDQFNVSPVTVTQLNVLTVGGSNKAIVYSGNNAWVTQ